MPKSRYHRDLHKAAKKRYRKTGETYIQAKRALVRERETSAELAARLKGDN